MKPIILAKSALNLAQMKNKMDLGADALEIQLLDELVNEDGSINSIERAFTNTQIKNFLEIPVLSVHAPLMCYSDKNIDIPPNLEVYAQPQYITLFNEVCRLAQMYGKKQNEIVKVVTHLEIDISRKDVVNQFIINSICNMVSEALNFFPNIDICVENVMPIRKVKENGEVILGCGYGYDNIELVNLLREKNPKNKDRIHTVLDTCHAEVTSMTIAHLSKFDARIDLNKYSIDKFFENNRINCGLIHLSRTINNGIGKGNHGQPFKESEEDIYILRRYLTYYKAYNYSCPIVLEVAEEDYKVSDGFKISNQLLRKEIEKW